MAPSGGQILSEGEPKVITIDITPEDWYKIRVKIADLLTTIKYTVLEKLKPPIETAHVHLIFSCLLLDTMKTMIEMNQEAWAELYKEQLGLE
jgi:hypothetical protein